MELIGQKILITGATGQLAWYIASNLAKDNDVHAMARFSAEGSMDRLLEAGMSCIKRDYASDDLSDIEPDFDYVLHFATYQIAGSEDFDEAIRVNAVGTGKLMHHFRNVKGFFFSSTCSVYQPAGAEPRSEDSPLGDSMRGHAPTYSFSKVAAEAVVKFNAQQFNIPTVIARMNVSYGNNGGLPVLHLNNLRNGDPIYLHHEKPNYYSPIHERDYFDKMVQLLDHVSTEPTVVNWAGSQIVSAEEWCEYMADILGVKPNFVYMDLIPGAPADTSKMEELVGKTSVDWRDGMRELIEQEAADYRQK
ncbi:NAD(P)-dependent oxidoreductase [Endozoicomonas sp. OPT23]|uniref:NAD-dependent epimerase/dehydratase family protein n=1 Tax=Endozoicomonas sp. OPT23 TaxID=2072845 RepID=UPI001891254B|nr:NAD(P)-dependent oxidoreductase [Endozoicomonas sp. OPT23]